MSQPKPSQPTRSRDHEDDPTDTSLYYREPGIELHVGDALDVMTALPTVSVNCVVTSPPYWGLRDYGTAVWIGGSSDCSHTLGATPHQRRTASSANVKKHCRKCGAIAHDQQYGHEPTPEKYADQLRQVFAEVWRVLTADGTAWLNLGDTYSPNSDGSYKSLAGIPWRVAFALRNDGWIVRNAIVWHKPNAMPESVQDRLSARHEMLFLLIKQQHYHFDRDAIRQPYTADRPLRRKTHYGGNKDNTIKMYWTPQAKGKNPGDVWSMSTRPLREAHCAPFPIDLPLRCIAAGCREDGVVLDPFSGAGTTGLATYQLNRKYVGIDLRADYHDIFLRRLSQHTQKNHGNGRTGENVA